MNRLFRNLFLILVALMLNPLVCVLANDTIERVTEDINVNLTKYKGSIHNYIPLWERDTVSLFSHDTEVMSGDLEPTVHDFARVCYDEIDEENQEISLMSVTVNDYSDIHGTNLRNRVNNPRFSSGGSNYVSQFDGSLQLNYTEISLPGRNGLDLTLGHFFQNEHCQEEILFVDGEYCLAPVNYFNKRYALGLGWSFSFPSVELRKRPDGEYQAYYHDGNGNVYRSNYKDSTKNEAGEDYYNGYLIYSTNLDNYFTDNVRFHEKDRSYTRDGVRSQYSFKRADNTKEYFAEDGRLIAIKDRFDNEIKFDYMTYPAENIIPFYTCHKYDLGSDWVNKSSFIGYDGDSTASNSTAETQYAELDDLCDDYYISLLYEAVDDFSNPYEGSFEVYCDLYSDTSELLESILIDSVTPEIYDELIQVEGNISLNDYYFDDEPTKAKIRIKVKSTKNDILFTDIRLSPYRPLMSRITDTVGRTIDFEYQGELYTRYEETTRHPIIATVKAPGGEVIRTIKYSRSVRTVGFNDADDDPRERHHYYFLRSWHDGEKNYAPYYDYKPIQGSLTYARTSSTYPYYHTTSRPVIAYTEYRNRKTHFEYEKVQKWVDNRPMGSSEEATIYNTCFYETFRVVKKADVDRNIKYSDDTAYNIYTYDYNDGTYSDETAYNKHTIEDAEPGYLNPRYGANYIVKIKNPNGSIEQYEYTSHFFDSGFRRKWEIVLPLNDKKTVYESSVSNADYIEQEYTYDDNYAIISPTEIKTTESVGGVIREYYNKIQYDSDSCLPIVQTLPLTEDELSEIPVEKTIVTEYQKLSNRMFLPQKTVYYRSEDSAALTVKKNYDELGRVISEVDANNNTIYYEYSTKYAWLPSRVYFSDPENIGDSQRIAETLYLYNDNYGFGPTSVKVKCDDNSGYATTYYEYEPNYGNISKITEPDRAKKSYEYDNMGRIKAEYYPPYIGNGEMRFYSHKEYRYSEVEYDDRQLFKVEETLYSTPNSDYELDGLEDDFSDSDMYYYDDYGKLYYQSVKNVSEQYVYDKTGRVSHYRIGDDVKKKRNTLTYSYDGFDRVTSVADYDGNKKNAKYGSLEIEYTFLPAGSEISENHCVVNYDIYGNKISESIYPNGITSAPFTMYYEYDLAGNITKITDAKNNVTALVYDKLDNPVEITKPDGSRILYDYTKWNTVKTTTQYEENQPYSIHETFDNRGLSVSHRQIGPDIDTKPWYNYYNDSGRLFYSIAPDGTAYSYSYDNIGNNTYSRRGSMDVTNTYNPRGSLLYSNIMENGYYDSWVLYDYDGSATLPISKTDDSGTVWYEYDSLNNIGYLSFAADDYNVDYYVDYDRDQFNRISTIEANGEKTFMYEYYPDGMVKTLSYPDADIVTSYTYDNANQITKMETKKEDEILASYSYEYDEVGNIISVSGTQTASYTYDELNRLKTVTENGYTVTYEYDSRNNITKETRDNGYLKTYEYTGDNKLKRTVENGVETQYEYDLNGNLIRRNGDIFAYDSMNRLVYSCVDGEVCKYEISVNGLRWRKKRSGHLDYDYYIYDDGGNLLSENDDNFVAFNGKVLAKTIDGCYYYYIYNAHGDVVMIVDEEGNIKNMYQYDAWGSIVSQSETVKNNHKYAGEYFDDETGLIYLRARYYDAQSRRFTQEDPARDEHNWYVYCRNNPIRYIDPLGLDAILITSTDSAAYQGHTSALYQDSVGRWYYTYWGGKAAAVIRMYDVSSLQAFNSELSTYLEAKKYAGITSDYEKATYVVGDFSLSLAEAYSHVSEAQNHMFSDGTLHTSYDGSVVYEGKNGSYSVVSDNCFDRTISTFELGTLENGMNASFYGMYHGINVWGISRPNSNVALFETAFGNSSFTYEGAYDSVSAKIKDFKKRKYHASPIQIDYFSSFVN